MRISFNSDCSVCFINVNNWEDIMGSDLRIGEREIDLDGHVYVRDGRSDCGDFFCYKIAE